MKRILLVFTAVLLSLLATGMFHEQTRAVRLTVTALRHQEISVTNELVLFENERLELRRAVARQKAERNAPSPTPGLDPALVDWLCATNYARVPRSIVSALRAALGFPWNDSPDFVLVSKPTLNDLTMPTVNREDKLSKTLCAVLEIGPEAQQQIESALSKTRDEYVAWAKTNLVREGPSGDALFTYKIPASPEQTQLWTNALFAAFQNAVGSEREALLEKHASEWIRYQVGFLGATANELKVSKRMPGGEVGLYYRLTRDDGSGESGRVSPNHLHPTFLKLFPGGWPEIAQREGFELPEVQSPAR